jgi:hypothetical protein
MTPCLFDELPEYEDPDGVLENEDDIDLGEETIDETE